MLESRGGTKTIRRDSFEACFIVRNIFEIDRKAFYKEEVVGEKIEKYSITDNFYHKNLRNLL